MADTARKTTAAKRAAAEETPTTTSPTSELVNQTDPGDVPASGAGTADQLDDETRTRLEAQRDTHNDPLGLAAQRDDG